MSETQPRPQPSADALSLVPSIHARCVAWLQALRPDDWFEAERKGEPLDLRERAIVIDLCRNAFHAGARKRGRRCPLKTNARDARR